MESCETVASNMLIDYSTKLTQETIKRAKGLFLKYNIFYNCRVFFLHIEILILNEDFKQHIDISRQETQQSINRVYV